MSYLPHTQAEADTQLINALARQLNQMNRAQVQALVQEAIRLGLPVQHPLDCMDSLLEVMRRQAEHHPLQPLLQ